MLRELKAICFLVNIIDLMDSIGRHIFSVAIKGERCRQGTTAARSSLNLSPSSTKAADGTKSDVFKDQTDLISEINIFWLQVVNKTTAVCSVILPAKGDMACSLVEEKWPSSTWGCKLHQEGAGQDKQEIKPKSPTSVTGVLQRISPVSIGRKSSMNILTSTLKTMGVNAVHGRLTGSLTFSAILICLVQSHLSSLTSSVTA